MIVFCIERDYKYLTYGRKYDVISTYASDEDGYEMVHSIIDDLGDNLPVSYQVEWFVTLDEWREIKINEILL